MKNNLIDFEFINITVINSQSHLNLPTFVLINKYFT